MHQPDTEHSCTSLSDLPPHLQHHIFASAAAPLTTCKASAAIASDASLTAQWLLVKHRHPLWPAVRHQLWDVCGRLLSTHQYKPIDYELCHALERTAEYGVTDVMSGLLQWCCKDHQQQCGVCTSLHHALFRAASKGHVSVVSLLARHPAITAQCARDAVCAAAKWDHLEVLKVLITTRPDASDSELRNCSMTDAAMCGQLAAMQLLVQHGADVHNSEGKPWSSRAVPGFRYLPAHAAAGSGHLEVVRWFHEQGMVDVEVGAGLVTAARGGHVPVVRYLLQECGADASLYGPTALRVALEDGRLEAVCLLLEAGTPTDDVVALTQAARRGLRRFNPEQFDTVLQAATQHGHVEFAEMLRDLRATAN